MSQYYGTKPCLYFCPTLIDLQNSFTARLAPTADNLQQNSIKIPTWFKLTDKQTHQHSCITSVTNCVINRLSPQL